MQCSAVLCIYFSAVEYSALHPFTPALYLNALTSSYCRYIRSLLYIKIFFEYPFFPHSARSVHIARYGILTTTGHNHCGDSPGTVSGRQPHFPQPLPGGWLVMLVSLVRGTQIPGGIARNCSTRGTLGIDMEFGTHFTRTDIFSECFTPKYSMNYVGFCQIRRQYKGRH